MGRGTQSPCLSSELPGCTLFSKGSTLTPTPFPTLGRSWPSWSCRNSWCSWRPGEYLPLSLALSLGPWE